MRLLDEFMMQPPVSPFLGIRAMNVLLVFLVHIASCKEILISSHISSPLLTQNFREKNRGGDDDDF